MMSRRYPGWIGIVLLSASGMAAAQVDCVRRQGGGYSCFDYQRGHATDVVPRDGGGVSAFDHESGNYREIVPRRGGGYSVYDSRTAPPRDPWARRHPGADGYDAGNIGGGVPGQGGIGGFPTGPVEPPGRFPR